MTSGTFTQYPIASISINRASRQRREITPEDVASLADSIKRQGLIHPIVITRGGDLVAGESRLEACRTLGMTKISAQFVDTLEPRALKEIELEENVKRKDLSWQEKCLALYELHSLYKDENPEWDVERTGEAVGYSPTSVKNQIAVAKELLAGNTMVAEAPVFSTARGIVQRKTERALADEDILLTEVASPIKVDCILTEDFNKWSATYEGPPFNFVHCDFPYGIGADKFNQGSAKSFGGYADTESGYWRLVASLLDNRERFLSESAHLIFWFSPKHYSKTLEALRSAFWVDDYPLVWNKVNTGIIPDAKMGPRRVYEMAFLCANGRRPLIRSSVNLCTEPLAKDQQHMSEKAEPMLRHFFKMFVDENTHFLDPTCGSGSSLRAIKSLGAKRMLGLEINPAFADNARHSLRSIV